MADPFASLAAPCRFLIIAPDEFAAELAPLVAHTNATNMPTHLVRLSQIIGSGAPPSSHPLSIKKLIARGHEEFGVWYVMLAGDASRVPVRHHYVQQPDGGEKEGMDGTYNPTDNYYTNLYRPGGKASGFATWDENSNGRFNEMIWGISPAKHNPDNIDGWPHVAVARLPAHTPQDVGNYTGCQDVCDPCDQTLPIRLGLRPALLRLHPLSVGPAQSTASNASMTLSAREGPVHVEDHFAAGKPDAAGFVGEESVHQVECQARSRAGVIGRDRDGERRGKHREQGHLRERRLGHLDSRSRLAR